MKYWIYHSWPLATRNKFNISLVITITTCDIFQYFLTAIKDSPITWYLLLTTKYTRFSKVHIPYRAKKSYLDMGVLKKIDFQWENRQIRKIFTWLDTLVGRQFRFTFCDVLTSYASCYYTIYIIRYLLYQLIFYTVIL